MYVKNDFNQKTAVQMISIDANVSYKKQQALQVKVKKIQKIDENSYNQRGKNLYLLRELINFYLPEIMFFSLTVNLVCLIIKTAKCFEAMPQNKKYFHLSV